MKPFAECSICGAEVFITRYVHVHVEATAACDYICLDCWRDICLEAKNGLEGRPPAMQAWWKFSKKP